MAYKILVVDDEAHILHVVSLKLCKAGLDVITAQDGEEGLETFLAEHPDLIITDFQMPRMTGVEFCKEVRRQEQAHHVPVILLTARGFDVDPSEIMAADIAAVLEKPFSPQEVLTRVQQLLPEKPTHVSAEVQP
ncbi:hypothetical protein LCGC14_0321000 [marine sediment metagenome]|uniref:Response regulatory domain-containing protein n=1 Tax=marine sediment metagenome TaxID=412755 RepID=A0A0F9WRA7_9ZZZZ